MKRGGLAGMFEIEYPLMRKDEAGSQVSSNDLSMHPFVGQAFQPARLLTLHSL